MTKDDKYRRVAYNALRWIFSTMRKDGVIPYVLAAYGSSLEKHGDPAMTINCGMAALFDCRLCG